jgi:co-chaperonin GroES (HSP10)
MSKIVCVGDNILVKLPEISKVTEAGIIKTDDMIAAESKDSNILEVVVAGPDCKTIRAKDKILIRNTHLPIFEIDGQRYGGLREFEVFCIVK